MTGETIEVTGIDKPFTDCYYKREHSDSRDQAGDMEIKCRNVTACLNANPI